MQIKFWHLDGIDNDTGEDVTGYLTTAAEDELPPVFSSVRDEILYWEVEDEQDAKDMASDLMMYTLKEVVVFPFKLNDN